MGIKFDQRGTKQNFTYRPAQKALFIFNKLKEHYLTEGDKYFDDCTVKLWYTFFAYPCVLFLKLLPLKIFFIMKLKKRNCAIIIKHFKVRFYHYHFNKVFYKKQTIEYINIFAGFFFLLL